MLFSMLQVFKVKHWLFAKTTLNSLIYYQNYAQGTYESINRTLHLLYGFRCYQMNKIKMKNTVNKPVNSALISTEKWFVGMTGFEPATTRTPCVYATRLRHIPEIGLQI